MRFFDRFKAVLKSLDVATLASRSGFRRREERKVTAKAALWALVLGAVGCRRRTVAAVAHLAGLLGGVPITRQGFHKRLGAEAVLFVRGALERLIEQAGALCSGPLPGALSRFSDLALLDSTTLRLADRLARLFPACRTNVRCAALKIHTQMSLETHQVERLRLSAERVHDRRGAILGGWVRDRLVVFDLGYFAYALFAQILRDGGAFLTRLKENANGTIVRVRRGARRRHEGGELNRGIYRGNLVDLDVAFGPGQNPLVLRVVGIFNAKRRDYHWYVTSLPPEEFSPEEVAQIYGLRWQIELLYKEWKGLCRLQDLASQKVEVVLVFLFASLAASVVSRIALALAALRFRLPWHSMCPPVAVSILGHFALHLGQALVPRAGPRLRDELDQLLVALAAHARLANPSNALLDFTYAPR